MTDDDPEKKSEPWHLDRKVSITLILAIVAQTCGAVWWAATLDSRVKAFEDKVTRVEAKIDAQHDDPVRLARLEGGRDEQNRRLDRIEAKLDRLLEHWSTK